MSHCHTVTLSHCHTVTLSHYHTAIAQDVLYIKDLSMFLLLHTTYHHTQWQELCVTNKFEHIDVFMYILITIRGIIN